MSKINNNKSNNKPSIPSGNNTAILKPKWQHVVLIIFITVAVYSNTLKNEFAYDDKHVIVENSLIKNIKNIPLFFKKPVISGPVKGYRPLTMVSFVINHKLGGLNVVGYHIGSIIFHTANAVLVYMLIVTLSSMVMGRGNLPEKNNNRYTIALFISLVFATHPINSEAVNYIWQRSVLMATFFYLLAVILFIRYSTERKSKLFLFSIISYILALMSKEIAITFPLIIILMDLYFISNFNKDRFIKNFKRCHFLFIFITFTYSFIKFFSHGDIREFVSPVKTSMFNYFITQFRVIVKYFRLIIIPKGLSVDHVFPVSESIMDIRVLCAFVVIMVIILISIRLMKVSKTVSLFMLWFFIALIPTSSILPLQIIMNEHRLYLPGIGFFTAFIILIYKFTPDKLHKKILPVLLSIIIIIFSGLTINRNTDWKNDFSLWSKNLQNYPNSWKALIARGNAYKEKGLLDKAILEYSRAVVLNPKYTMTYHNRGLAYKKRGLHDKAISDFNKAIELNDKYVEAYYERGNIYGEKGLHDRAIADFSKAIELWPKYSNAYISRGAVYWKKGFSDKAIADSRIAIRLDPGNTMAQNNMSIIREEMSFSKAIAEHNKAIELNQEDSNAYNDRGVTYWKKGFLDKALSDYNKAIEINSKNSEAYNNRGIIYDMKSFHYKAIADFDKAIKLNPKNAGTYRNRALTYRKIGKEELAKQDEEKVKSLMKRE